MSLSIEIKNRSGINLTHLSNLAEEYFGTVLHNDNDMLTLHFDNHSYAQNFRKTIQPYFSGSFVNN